MMELDEPIHALENDIVFIESGGGGSRGGLIVDRYITDILAEHVVRIVWPVFIADLNHHL